MTLEAGLERSDEFTAEGRLLTDVGGTIAVKVLSTPGMISMMERCASILAIENLSNGRATVGFEVCVKHVAAAGEGARCTVRARIREVVDGRKVRFDVEVREGERTIGVGTHERRVIDRMGPRAVTLPTIAGRMIERDQVLHVARLARLRLTDEEVDRMAGELSEILEHVETMNELALEGVEPTSHVVELQNVLREDVPRESLPPRKALEQAPDTADAGFRVPSPGQG